MKKKAPMTRKKKVDLSKADEFISGAEKPSSEVVVEKLQPPAETTVKKETKKTPTTALPWDSANDKIIKAVNLRLNESQHSKLKYIADNSPFSIQKFIMSVLEPAIELKIKDIMK